MAHMVVIQGHSCRETEVTNEEEKALDVPKADKKHSVNLTNSMVYFN